MKKTRKPSGFRVFIDKGGCLLLDVRRIVPSKGCDVHLLQTEEKAVLLDTGMFHCSENTIKLLKDALNGRKLDFVLLSHTHYDHVGGIPALREAYPGLKIYGSEYAAYVLGRRVQGV